MLKRATVCGTLLAILIVACFLIPPAFLHQLIARAEKSSLRPGSVRTLISTLPVMGEEQAIRASELGLDSKVQRLVDNLSTAKALETAGLYVPIQNDHIELVLHNLHGVVTFSEQLEDEMMLWIIAPSEDRQSVPIQFNSEEYTLNIRGQLKDRQDIAVYIALPADLRKLYFDMRVADVEILGDRISGLENIEGNLSGSRVFLNLAVLETIRFQLKAVTSRVEMRLETLVVEDVFNLETIGGPLEINAKTLNNNGGSTRGEFKSTFGIISLRLGRRPKIALHPNPSLGEIWVQEHEDPDVLGLIDLYATSRLASINIQ